MAHDVEVGFEVLDAGGRPGEPPDVRLSGRADRIQPLELDPQQLDPQELDPQELDPQEPPQPALRRGPGLPPGTWWKVAAAGVLGIAIGAVATQHHATDVAEAREARQVVAHAQFSDVSPRRTDGGTVADVRVAVSNLGTRPFDVLLTTPGSSAPPAGAAAQYHMSSGTSTVRPGETETFSTSVQLDCRSSDPISLTVPVRSAAGTASRLPVQSMDESASPMNGLDLCPIYGDQSGFSSTVGGTLSRPTLRLSNSSGEPVVVTLDSGSPLTEAPSQRLSLTTVPALPLRIPAHSHRTVRLQLRAHSCLAGTDASAVDGLSYVGLRADDLTGNQVSSSGMDIGALVGLAMARSCS